MTSELSSSQASQASQAQQALQTQSTSLPAGPTAAAKQDEKPYGFWRTAESITGAVSNTLGWAAAHAAPAVCRAMEQAGERGDQMLGTLGSAVVWGGYKFVKTTLDLPDHVRNLGSSAGSAKKHAVSVITGAVAKVGEMVESVRIDAEGFVEQVTDGIAQDLKEKHVLGVVLAKTTLGITQLTETHNEQVAELSKGLGPGMINTANVVAQHFRSMAMDDPSKSGGKALSSLPAGIRQFLVDVVSTDTETGVQRGKVISDLVQLNLLKTFGTISERLAKIDSHTLAGLGTKILERVPTHIAARSQLSSGDVEKLLESDDQFFKEISKSLLDIIFPKGAEDLILPDIGPGINTFVKNFVWEKIQEIIPKELEENMNKVFSPASINEMMLAALKGRGDSAPSDPASSGEDLTAMNAAFSEIILSLTGTGKLSGTLASFTMGSSMLRDKVAKLFMTSKVDAVLAGPLLPLADKALKRALTSIQPGEWGVNGKGEEVFILLHTERDSVGNPILGTDGNPQLIQRTDPVLDAAGDRIYKDGQLVTKPSERVEPFIAKTEEEKEAKAARVAAKDKRIEGELKETQKIVETLRGNVATAALTKNKIGWFFSGLFRLLFTITIVLPVCSAIAGLVDKKYSFQENCNRIDDFCTRHWRKKMSEQIMREAHNPSNQLLAREVLRAIFDKTPTGTEALSEPHHQINATLPPTHLRKRASSFLDTNV